MSGPVHVDVIVPTRNRPADLERLVAAMCRQTFADFTVLVVDQSDDVAPAERVVAAADDPRIVHVADPRRGKSLALNAALDRCTGDIVAFTDDDCEPSPDWLAHAVGRLTERPDVDLMFGNVVAYPHDSDHEFVPAIELPATRTIRGPVLKSYGLIGMGANMVARRAAIEAVGRFDRDLGPGGPLLTGEECELTYRVLQSGRVVMQDPESNVVHYGGRPVAGGVAHDLVNIGFFAIGAGYGKHVRRGELRAFVVVIHELLWIVGLILRAVVLRRRPFHVRRLARFADGLRRGMSAGPRWGIA